MAVDRKKRDPAKRKNIPEKIIRVTDKRNTYRPHPTKKNVVISQKGREVRVPLPDEPISAKEQRYVDEFILDFNQQRAAVAAGFPAKSAEDVGRNLRKQPNIVKAILSAIEARNERIEVKQDMVVMELAKIAFSDVTEIAAWNGFWSSFCRFCRIESPGSCLDQSCERSHYCYDR